jgi:hypothetical protein
MDQQIELVKMLRYQGFSDNYIQKELEKFYNVNQEIREENTPLINQREIPKMWLDKTKKKNYGIQDDEEKTIICIEFKHLKEKNCCDIFIIDTEQKEFLKRGACVEVETDRGFHYFYEFDGFFDINNLLNKNNESKLLSLWGSSLQDNKYLNFTINERKFWVQFTHNKENNTRRIAKPLKLDWEDFCQHWNSLVVASELQKI